jgi:hypothetical protein
VFKESVVKVIRRFILKTTVDITIYGVGKPKKEPELLPIARKNCPLHGNLISCIEADECFINRWVS